MSARANIIPTSSYNLHPTPNSSLSPVTPKTTPTPAPMSTPAAPSARPWQDSLHTPSQALNFLLASGTLSDVTLVVGKEGRQFKVHRLLLAMRSPVFEDLLLLNPAGGSSEGRRKVLELREESPQAVYWLLNHIYCDMAEMESVELALGVLSVADKYMVASAYDLSIRHIQDGVKRNNVLQVYHHLVHTLHHHSALTTLCRKVFQDNGNAVLMSPALLALTPEALKQLLQEPLRITSEAVIFTALLKWGQAQVKLRHHTNTPDDLPASPPSPSALRREIYSFLPMVRFLTMSSEDFVQSVVTSDVLTAEECVYVLKGIARGEGDEGGGEERSYSASSLPGFKVNPSRESRAAMITKDTVRACVCGDVSRAWLSQHTHYFRLVASDNIVLVGVRAEVKGGSEVVQLEIHKEGHQPNSPSTSLAKTEGRGGDLSFPRPVHLREGVTYLFSLTLPDPDTVLYGSEEARQYEMDGFRLSLSPGVLVREVLFF